MNCCRGHMTLASICTTCHIKMGCDFLHFHVLEWNGKSRWIQESDPTHFYIGVKLWGP